MSCPLLTISGAKHGRRDHLYYRSLSHCYAWPAEGRSDLHIDRSVAVIQAALTSCPPPPLAWATLDVVNQVGVSTLSVKNLIITGSIVCSAKHQYLSYSEVDFEVFCTIGGELWRGGLLKGLRIYGVLSWQGLVIPTYSVPPSGETMRQTPKVLEVQEHARGPLSPCQVWWRRHYFPDERPVTLILTERWSAWTPNHAHIDGNVQHALRNWPWLSGPVGIGSGGVA